MMSSKSSTKTFTNLNYIMIQVFCFSLNLPKLTEEQVDCPLSRRELLDAIKELMSVMYTPSFNQQ